MFGVVLCAALACATRSSSPSKEPSVATPPPEIDFAIVEPAAKVSTGADVIEYKGEKYRAREIRPFQFATALPTEDELGWPAVVLIIDPREAMEFSRWTEANINQLLAVLVDRRPLTIGSIHDRLPATAMLSSAEPWSKEQAMSLATRIHAAGTAAPRAASNSTSSPRAFEFAAPYEPTPGSPVEIALERGICFGKCPQYTLLVRGDGSVVYHGKESVRIAGDREATVRPETIRRLLARFCAADFLSMPDRSASGLEDSSPIVLTLTVNGRTKRVEHLYGGGPWNDDPDGVVCAALDALSDAVDDETGSRRWTGP